MELLDLVFICVGVELLSEEWRKPPSDVVSQTEPLGLHLSRKSTSLRM